LGETESQFKKQISHTNMNNRIIESNEVIPVAISSESESDIDKSIENISQLRRASGKIYINPQVFESVLPIKIDSVPDDINGLIVYEVPLLKSLRNCKGARPWGKAVSSKLASFTEGPRLLFSCRGSYVCQNTLCPNLADFGINRQDFTHSNERVKCSICTAIALYVSCDARLYIEKNLHKKKISVKHYAYHSCLISIKGRPETDDIKKLINAAPKITREGIIRQFVGSKVENCDFEAAVNVAKQLINTKFIDNLKANAKKISRPHGHSFTAVQRIKESWDKQDKYLNYNMDDGELSFVPFVFKSSKRKVNIMFNMDKDGMHPLNSAVVHLDVIHSRCKGWKTYTLSYYDIPLQSMIKLCTMETSSECKEACQIFLENINEMLRDFIKEKDPNILDSSHEYKFNPFHLKDDEAGGNKIAMRNILGEPFVETRTSSCEYHFDASVARHRKFVRQEDVNSYSTLCYDWPTPK